MHVIGEKTFKRLAAAGSEIGQHSQKFSTL
jgi:hypothetical protein